MGIVYITNNHRTPFDGFPTERRCEDVPERVRWVIRGGLQLGTMGKEGRARDIELSYSREGQAERFVGEEREDRLDGEVHRNVGFR